MQLSNIIAGHDCPFISCIPLELYTRSSNVAEKPRDAHLF